MTTARDEQEDLVVFGSAVQPTKKFSGDLLGRVHLVLTTPTPRSPHPHLKSVCPGEKASLSANYSKSHCPQTGASGQSRKGAGAPTESKAYGGW